MQTQLGLKCCVVNKVVMERVKEWMMNKSMPTFMLTKSFLEDRPDKQQTNNSKPQSCHSSNCNGHCPLCALPGPSIYKTPHTSLALEDFYCIMIYEAINKTLGFFFFDQGWFSSLNLIKQKKPPAPLNQC